MKPRCEVHHLGRMDYQQAWQLQGGLAAEIARGERPPSLLLLEHPHTYTFGSKGRRENLLWDEAEQERRGVQLYWVDRGGDVTYHGPGQLVGYPLLPLAPGGLVQQAQNGKPRLPQADYVGYLRRLEESLIVALGTLGVTGERVEGLTGVWVRPEASQPPAKIAAIGVKVDAHGISRHGFALNIDPDMSYWQGIVGCGLKDHAVTSLAALVDSPPTLQQVSEAVIAALGEVFGYQMSKAMVKAVL